MNDETSDEKILGKFDNYEQLEKSYKELESKLGKKSEPKAPVADAGLAEELKALKAEIAAERKERADAIAKANHPLNNADFKKQLAAGLSNLPQEKVAEINKRISEGKVEEAELKIYASLAAKPKESTAAVGSQGESVGNYESAEQEYFNLIEKSTEWMDEKHPNFVKARERKEALEKKLGI